jgi:hypothetical protein
MATSEYRVIESADGTFTVEAWDGSGMLLFERVGFRTREEAEAWITPVPAKESHPITTTKRTRGPAWFIDVETEEYMAGR